jgi:hypothetical protein
MNGPPLQAQSELRSQCRALSINRLSNWLRGHGMIGRARQERKVKLVPANLDGWHLVSVGTIGKPGNYCKYTFKKGEMVLRLVVAGVPSQDVEKQTAEFFLSRCKFAEWQHEPQGLAKRLADAGRDVIDPRSSPWRYSDRMDFVTDCLL